jgi:hypothetical protein
MPLTFGTLVEVGVSAVFRGHKYGWVIRQCLKDGGTIVSIPELEAGHEVCVKEHDFIAPVRKKTDDLSGEVSNKS